MKVLLIIPFFLMSLSAWCGTNGPDNGAKFDFSKPVYKVQGVIKKVDGDFVIIPTDSKSLKFIPSYLPEEYKKNGLEVTFDGDVAKAEKSGTPLNIHKIWVAYEIKEKYKLVHKNYDLN